ncbi:MAG TPA: M1 family aminopeptidase [Abditibacteriaceae bacterium]|jgi:hypothetical protein
MKRYLFSFLALFFVAGALRLHAQNSVPVAAAVVQTATRPHYAIRANIDAELLAFSSDATITIPVAPDDAMRDVVLFIFANAGGVGGLGEKEARVKNITVQSVQFAGKSVPFTLDGAVLRVTLPQPQRQKFSLDIAWKGVVPRAPESSGGLAEMMGGMDLGGLFGGGAAKTKPKNVDYGLYSYGNGVMSLGSFWYPVLAIRRDGKWIDEAPEGLGDVAYAELSDYRVTLVTSPPAIVAATGSQLRLPMPVPRGHYDFAASGVRDFAVLASADFVLQSKNFDVAGKTVEVESYTTKAHAAKGEKAIDIAGKALQIFAKRFGPYPYSSFKVVEGPIRGGAGGMEYSGMTAIASMLYGDLGKELGGLAESLGAPGVNAKALENLLGDDAPAATNDANPAADLLGGMLGQQKEVLDSVFEMTIAHEVAHQWWAIGVGSDSQRAPWLDESLTNYSSIVYFEDRYGKAAAARMADLHLKTGYSTARMLGQSDAAVNKRTSAYDGNVQYGAIVYGKGALFYDALRTEIGDAAFFGALRDYFAGHNGRLATGADLRRAFEMRAPAKKARIAALWKRWLEETHGDADITGGAPTGLADLLGGILGGAVE